MARAFEQSHAAYARKDGVAAKELSNEGKVHQREMERLNAEASAWIFRGEYRVLFCTLLFWHSWIHVNTSFVENNCVRESFFVSSDIPLMTYPATAFRIPSRGKLIYMDSTSRRLSHIPTEALLKHGREAIRRFASLSVRIVIWERGSNRPFCVCCIGKGIHTLNHAAKLKPAIEEHMQR